MLCQHKGALTCNPVYKEDPGSRIHLTDIKFKHLSLRLRDDIAFRNHDIIGKLQHRSDLTRRIDTGEIIDHTDRRNFADMRRTPVAQPRAFRDEHVKSASDAPFYGILNIAYKKMIRTDLAGKSDFHRYARLTVPHLIERCQTVEFHDSNFFHTALLQRLHQP